jgi:hypothetical protein
MYNNGMCWQWKCHKYTHSKHRRQPWIKGRITWHEHILSITSFTCTFRYFSTRCDKWGQLSLWDPHRGGQSPPLSPPRHAKSPWSMCEASQKWSSALRSTLCFLSVVQDQVTRIHRPTRKQNRHDNIIQPPLWHVGHAYRRRCEGPLVIGGQPTPFMVGQHL